MAVLSNPLINHTSVSPNSPLLSSHRPLSKLTNICTLLSSSPKLHHTRRWSNHVTGSYRFSSSGDCSNSDHHHHQAAVDSGSTFEEAVALFNRREYYKCHDFLEDLWNHSQEPARTLVHGILQCAVGFHHMFNQNHKGAMMELGEGLCKLRKMNLESGPFHEFEKEITAVLDFIYQTQLELAACATDFCLTMDQSERSYQLLGGYGSGQRIYALETGPKGILNIRFCPEEFYSVSEQPTVKLPILHASKDHFMDFNCD